MKIKIHPTGQELEGDPNKSVMQICHENKIEIHSLCKGIPSCAECRVKVLAGESNVIPPGKAELSLIGTSYYLDGRRLSCQLRAFGDISIDITPHLEKDDNTNKKVRGYRVQDKSFETKAVQGTLMLEENQGPRKGPDKESKP